MCQSKPNYYRLLQMVCGLNWFKGGFGSAANFELDTWIRSKPKSSAANRRSFWIWRNWIISISKVFAFSMHVRRRGSRSCAVRLTSGNGCCRNEVSAKAFDIENQMIRVDLYRKGEWS